MTSIIFEMSEDEFLAFDFQYSVLQAARFQNWWENNKTYTFLKNINIVDYQELTFPEHIPVGSIEFTEAYFKVNFKPINVPKILQDSYYSGRTIV